jgi:hypothetical protein
MANQDKSRNQTDASNVPPEGAGGTEQARASSPAERFVRIHEEYVRQLRENWLAAQKGVHGLYSKLIENRQAHAKELSQKLADAWRKYIEEAQKLAGGSPADHQRSAIESHLRYQSELLQIRVEAARRWDAITREYRDGLRTAQTDYAQHCNSAYQRCLELIRSTWVGVDPKSLDASNLASAGQVLIQAARQHAACVQDAH